MAQKTLQTRLKLKKDTAANWESKNPVLLDGEQIFIITAAGETRVKVGDGTKTYTQLPFTDEPLRTLISTKESSSEVTTKLATKADKTTTITADNGLTGGGDLSANITISHADTSSVSNVTANGRKYVTGLTFDDYGHVTNVTTGTETVTNTDTKVTQTLTSSNASYPLLLAPSGQTANATTTSYFDSGVTLNPSTNTIAANISGNASTATALTSSAGSATQPVYFSDGKPIATTYTLEKSVPSDAKFTDTTYSDMTGATSSAAGTHGLVPAPASGKQTSYLRGDGTWAVPTNTTYTAGTGLSLNGTTFNHSNSVTADTAQGDASKTLTFGGTFTIPTVTYDAQGHITGKGTTTMTMPSNPNSDTKVNVTLGTTTKAYLLGTSTTPTSTAAGVTAIADTGVYLDTTAGKLTAGSFAGNGASLTSLNASNISSGTIAAARLPVATSSNIGGVKSGTDITVDSSGNVSVNNDSHTHSDSTITSLDASKLTGTIPSSILPSYVDDVIECNNLDSFPITGETGKIYVDLSTNLTYRWSGTQYVEISPSLALGTTSSTAFRGDYGNTAYTHATEKGSAFSSGLYKITTNTQGHVTAATAVTKNDITGLGIPDAPFKPAGKSYLTFSSPNSFTLAVSDTTKHWDGTLEYFASDKTWTVWDGTTTLSSFDNDGDNVLYLRGTGNTKIIGNFDPESDSYTWVLTGSNINCIGNIENLLDYATVESGAHPTMATYCYYRMFAGCTALVQAPELPATTLAEYCYNSMFMGCSLTQAPSLPATTLVEYCYWGMFLYCTSLTQAPALPATTLADNCYYGMFMDCTSLTQAPALPATTLASDCYFYMFCGCTSLTQAPALPATTLAEYCYWGMFNDCTSLTQAPALPATTLAAYCYYSMFEGCISLTKAPALPATTLAEYCYCGMFAGCTALIKAPSLPATTLENACYGHMFTGCYSLAQVPALPATVLTESCYYSMFIGCESIKLSTIQTGEYIQEYRIPSSGTGTTATDALTDMFTDTGGTFTETPEINTTYYLSTDNMIVRETEIATLNGYVGSMIDVAIGNAIGGSY